VSEIRSIIAQNASAMTLDGTRTYVIGRTRVAIIDPGPLLPEHLNAVAEAVGSGASVSVLITHSHPDHSEGAQQLAEHLRTSVTDLWDRRVIDTDSGALEALATPGHTPDHFSFLLPGQGAVFCGDLMMGGMDTALVAPPEGNLQQYLQSLERVRALGPRVIYPAHGEPFHDAAAAIGRYVQHRMDRVVQVLTALRRGPQTAEALVDSIYGAALDPQLRDYASSAVEAYLVYLSTGGRVQVSADGVWSLL
jgi:glyoxylase-like metal-dependent hydrolase (beta-lactamase superfamily II)